MAIAHVQSGDGGQAAPGTVISASFAATVGSGNLVAGFVYFGSGTTTDLSSITDDKGNTYTVVDTVSGSSIGFNRCWASFYLANVTNAPQTITANFGASIGQISVYMDEYSGVATSAALDAHAMQAQASPGTGADGCSSGSATTAANGDLIYGGMVDMNGASGSDAAGTGFTIRLNNVVANGNTFNSTEDKIQSSAGSVAATFTLNSNVETICGMMAFKAPGGAATHGLKRNSNLDGLSASGPLFSDMLA